MKKLLRDLSPPFLLKAVRRARTGRYGFAGDFPTFAAARASADGYESPKIVSAVATRTTAAPTGPDIGMREQQVLAALALLPQLPRSVLDFGGANGGYYDLLRRFIGPVKWRVLETPAMVQGCKHRTTDELSWISSPDDAAEHYDLVFMSGVLQYLEDPHAAFRRLGALAPFTIVNRLPLVDGSRDRLTVQRVDPAISYQGSYPAWFFGRQVFEATVAERHEIVMRWDIPMDTAVLDGIVLMYGGILLRAR